MVVGPGRQAAVGPRSGPADRPALAEASADPLRPPARRAGGGRATSRGRSPPDPPEWIERLFASQAYKDQKELVRRHAPEDEVVRQHPGGPGGQRRLMTPAAFAQAADIPAARLDGLVARSSGC